MAEPVTSSYATGTVAAIALLSLFPGVQAAVVLGSFAGAVVFVMASDDLNLGKKAAFFVISFIAGCLAAPIAAGLLAGLLPARIAVSEGVGALIAAALAVRLLLWLIRRAENPADLLDSLKGGRK